MAEKTHKVPEQVGGSVSVRWADWRRKANAVFTRLICIFCSQNSYRTGGWDSPDAHLYKDLQMAVQILSAVIQVSWLQHSLPRAEKSPGIVWSYLQLLNLQSGRHIVPCIWDDRAQRDRSVTCSWPLKRYKTVADSEIEYLNKNTFSTKSRKGKTETKSIWIKWFPNCSSCRETTVDFVIYNGLRSLWAVLCFSSAGQDVADTYQTLFLEVLNPSTLEPILGP